MAQILFTARPGGTSVGAFDSLNLGDHVGDAPKSVEDNRRILQNLLSQSEPIFMNQVHGNEVVEIDENTQSPITADAAWNPAISLSEAVAFLSVKVAIVDVICPPILEAACRISLPKFSNPTEV